MKNMLKIMLLLCVMAIAIQITQLRTDMWRLQKMEKNDSDNINFTQRMMFDHFPKICLDKVDFCVHVEHEL